MRRHTLNLSASGGAAGGDTGPSFHGEVSQVRWIPDTDDTGQSGTLSLSLLMEKEGDTGLGFVVYSEASLNLGTDVLRYPRQPVVFSTGAGNSGDTGYVPVIAAGERLRGKVTPGDTGMVIAGRLIVWTRD